MAVLCANKQVIKTKQTRGTPHQTLGFHLALKGEHKQQSARRANHSTETAMPCHDINFALDNHDVLLDSSSRFDTIGRGVLIKKLCNRVGLSRSALAWIDS